MKLQVRSLLLALAMAGVAMAVHAQNEAASREDIDRCADWLQSVVPDAMKVNAALFCAGRKQEEIPNLGGWHSTHYCGSAAKPAADGKEPYCAASGSFTSDWTIAAGFKSAVGSGEDLFPNAQSGETSGAPATLYTRTPLQIGALRLPAGMYRFTISHPADGWKMTVAPETGEEIGTVSLTADTRLSYTGSGLAIGVFHSGFRCKDPVNVHELTFTYGETELYTCLRPDRIAAAPDGIAAR